MFAKIVILGMVLPYTVYDLYKIIEHILIHKMYVIKFLMLG
jgi:hypothetical protein